MNARGAMRVIATVTAAAALAGAPRASGVAIPCLSGFVRTGGGTPVAGADLDFFDAVTGVKLITPGDNTDAAGFYSVCVLPGVYDVTFAPPPGTRLLGKRIPALDLTANVGQELDVTLDPGTVIDGVVTLASNGQGVALVDIDVDFVSGPRVFTPGDNTDATGAYRIVVPNGRFRIRFEPPVGSRLRGVEMDSVLVAGDQTIGAVLEDGLLLTGRVSSSTGQPLVGVSVDMREIATGGKVFLANNETDAAGDYSVAAPAGVFELRYVPPLGAPYVAVSIDSFRIDADVQQDQVLQSGHRVTIAVRDFNGTVVTGADIDVKESATGAKIFTPNDKTSTAGLTDVILASGTYDIRVDPPPGTTLDRAALPGVVVTADRTIDVVLPEVVRRQIAGRVTDPFAVGIPGVVVEARLIPSAQPVFIPVPASDAAGNLDLSIPVGRYDVFFIPPATTRWVAHTIPTVTIAGDSAWSTVVLEPGQLLTVHVTGDDGRPVAGADLDVFRGPGRTEIFAPYDETDAAGDATVAVLPDEYTISITPPPGSGLAAGTAGPAAVARDTVITVVLGKRASARPPAMQIGPAVPNPFRDQTVVTYEVGSTTDASLDVFDVSGRHVRALRRQESVSGRFDVAWDGSDDRGRRVSSGIYIIRLGTVAGVSSCKVLLLR